MKKEEFETVCKKVGLQQEARVAIRDTEILIADGECNALGKEYLMKRGAIQLGQFPDGLYLTIWNMTDGKDYLITGNFMSFDKNHDKSFDEITKKRLRVDEAISNAIWAIELMRAENGKPN